MTDAELADDRAAGRGCPTRCRRGVRGGGTRRTRDDGRGLGGHRRRAARYVCATGYWPPSPTTRCANCQPERRKALAHNDFGRRGRRGDRARRTRRRTLAAAARRRRRPPSRCSPRRTCGPCRGAIPTGGTATLVFSHEKDAGVLVMNNVAAAAAGHRVPDVAGRRGIPEVGGHDGRQGGRTVDHCGAAGSRHLAVRWRSPSSPGVVPRSRPARRSPSCP